MAHSASKSVESLSSSDDSPSPKELLEIIQSYDDQKVNPELGVELGEILSGCLQHRAHKGKMKRAFFKFLNHDPKYSPSMDPVRHSDVIVPRLIASVMPDSCGDEMSKLRLVNQMLVDFAAGMKLANPPSDGSCPFLQPSTQCQYLRTLLSGMKEDYGWNFTLDKSFNFKGGVKTVIDHLFQKRRYDFKGVSFCCEFFGFILILY